jgi:hypothetical protein
MGAALPYTVCEVICFLAGGDHAAAEQNYYLVFTVARRQSAKLEELRGDEHSAALARSGEA